MSKVIGKVAVSSKIQSFFFRFPGYNLSMIKHLRSMYRFSQREDCAFRLQVVSYQKKWGTKATIEAYGISKATIFRWKRRL